MSAKRDNEDREVRLSVLTAWVGHEKPPSVQDKQD